MLAQTGTVSLTSIVVGVPRGLGGPSADISRSSPNNVDNNISVSKTSNNSNNKNINDNSSENMVIDSVSIEASSSVRRLPRSRTPWTASLQSPGKTSDQNKPLRGQWFPRLRSLPLS